MDYNSTNETIARGWGEAMQHHALAARDYRQIKRAYRDDPCPSFNAEFNLCTLEFVNAENALLYAPAPNLAALRWKLDRLLAIDTGETDAWSAEHVAQTVADVERLLAA